MAATEPLYRLTAIDTCKLSKKENLFLETELFMRICDELNEFFKSLYKEYFHLIKFDTPREDRMEADFFRCVISDILTTEEYSLSGIAYHTRIPEDVIYEVAIGKNTNPSLLLARKIIELHRSIRPDLYREIINKIRERDITTKQEEYSTKNAITLQDKDTLSKKNDSSK